MSEAERGCGFRKPGGLYLVSDGPSVVCDRLPVPIVPCACCGYEPAQIRSHSWVPGRWLGDHALPFSPGPGRSTRGKKPSVPCADRGRWGAQDVICAASETPRLLMWVGARFYTPAAFAEEADRLGVSKRIADLPSGLVLGKTWVLLAHPAACFEPVSWAFNWLYGDGEVGQAPGVFHAFIPQRAEIILHESEATPERIEREAKRGVSVVLIPDGAPDARVSWRPGEQRPEAAAPATQTVLPGHAPEITEAEMEKSKATGQSGDAPESPRDPEDDA